MTKDRSNDATNANAASGQSLRLFRTPPHACSYLEGQSANTVYLDPEIPPTRGFSVYSTRWATGAAEPISIDPTVTTAQPAYLSGFR